MFLPEYIVWHFKKFVPRVFHAFFNSFVFYFYYFNISFHVRTLFAPFKRQSVSTRKGFHPEELLTVLSFNLISRGVGFVIRFTTIFSGLAALVFLAFFGPLVCVLFLPPLFSFPVYLKESRLKQPKKVKIVQKNYTSLKSVLEEISKTEEGRFILFHLGIYDETRALLRTLFVTGDVTAWKRYLSSHPPFSLGDILSSLTIAYEPWKAFLLDNNITAEMIHDAAVWYYLLTTKPQGLSLDNLSSLLKIPPIGKNWGYGYTPNLDTYAADLADIPSLFPTVIGREDEIHRLEQYLRKHVQNSIVLVGEPGVGRHAIVRELAKRISSGYVLPQLSNKRVLSLDLKLLTSDMISQFALKKKIAEILQEAENAGNIILVLDNFHTYITASPGTIDLSDVFEQHLSSGKLQIIGILDEHSYHTLVLPNATLTTLFVKTTIEPPTLPVTAQELKLSIVPVFEQYYGVIVTLQAVYELIRDSSRYETATPFPERAIDLLDEIAVYSSSHQKKIIHASDVQSYISRKKKIPLGTIQTSERDILLHLEDQLHRYVIDQDEAITTIARAMRRMRTDIRNESKPAGSFLFLGPTGVGKTETAKALARVYFGSESAMIRLDMSQYQGKDAHERLIGSATSGQTGELTRAIIDHPFALLLLDELEKADKKSLNLLLTLLDEGYVEDGFGRKIDGKNLIIIATSNAASTLIHEKTKTGISPILLKKEVVNYIQSKEVFSPEFLNRFSDVVVFTPLSEGHIREVARLMLEKVNARLMKKGYSIAISSDLIKQITTKGYRSTFGAREIARIIERDVEDQIAQKILEGTLQKGDVIPLTLS